MANLTMEQFQKKLKIYGTKHPIFVKRGLRKGTEWLKKDIKARWSRHRRTGDMLRAIKTEVSLKPLHGRVFVGDVQGKSQNYKALALEKGVTIRAKNKPYLVFTDKGRTVKTKAVTIPADPAFRPSLIANQQRILYMIAHSLTRGYKSV